MTLAEALPGALEGEAGAVPQALTEGVLTNPLGEGAVEGGVMPVCVALEVVLAATEALPKGVAVALGEGETLARAGVCVAMEEGEANSGEGEAVAQLLSLPNSAEVGELESVEYKLGDKAPVQVPDALLVPAPPLVAVAQEESAAEDDGAPVPLPPLLPVSKGDGLTAPLLLVKALPLRSGDFVLPPPV